MATGLGLIISRFSEQLNGQQLRPLNQQAAASKTIRPPLSPLVADLLHSGPRAALPGQNVDPVSSDGIQQGKGILTKSFGDYWFERIHLIPKSMAFGNILGTIVKTMEIYNSFASQSHTLNSFVNGAGSGLTITNLPGLPFTIAASKGLSLTVQVTTLGVPTFDTTLDFVTDLYTLKLPVSGRRVFLLPYRPELPVVENVDFLTNVFEHQDGTEQRTALRLHPRLSYEFTLLREYGDEHARFEFLMYEWQQRVFGMPMWHEPAIATSAIAQGATTISVNSTTNASFKVGGLVMIYDSETNNAAMEIASLTSTSLTFTSTVPTAFSSGVEVYPVRLAITEASISGQRYKLGMVQYNLRMIATDNVDNIASTAGWNTFLSKVLLDDPNAVEGQMNETIQRRLYGFDNDTGKISQTSLWSRFRRGSSKAFVTASRANLWKVRQLMYALKGRQTSFYLPTFNKQLTVTQQLNNGTTTMFISNVGYSRFVQSRAGRNTIRVQFTDGTSVTKNITAAAEFSATEEQLTVDVAWSSTKTVAQISGVDFFEKVRFDSDRITFEHRSALGDCQMSAPVKGVLE